MANYSFAQLEKLWTDNGGDPKWAPTMAAVAIVESSGNPSAENSSGATGLWQVLPSAQAPWFRKQYPLGSLVQPNTNARAAVTLLNGGPGISNWTADPVGQYVVDNGGQPLSRGQAQSLLSTLAKGGSIGPVGSLGGQVLSKSGGPTYASPVGQGSGDTSGTGILSSVTGVVLRPVTELIMRAAEIILGALLLQVAAKVLRDALSHTTTSPTPNLTRAVRAGARRVKGS